MKRRITVLAALALLLTLAVGLAQADWGRAGNMISPAGLGLVSENAMVDRFCTGCSRYTWSYAPLYFKPEEREKSSLEGPAPTDAEVLTGARHVKLPGATGFIIEWLSGWSADSVTVSSWSVDVFGHPDRADEYYMGQTEPAYDRIVLEPGRVYQIHASWGTDPLDEEYGEADYYIVTERMTEEETAAAAARVGAPYTEEDMSYLTMRINGVDCILGQTTPDQLKRSGLNIGVENDGTYYAVGDGGFGFVYMQTENGGSDDPVVSLDAFWAYDDLSIVYRGYGETTEQTDDWDPDDDDWDTDDDDDDDDDDISWPEGYYMDVGVEGICTEVVTLSNGREVKISDHGSWPSVTLLPEKAF